MIRMYKINKDMQEINDKIDKLITNPNDHITNEADP